MSAVFSGALLDAIRRRVSATVVGGPVVDTTKESSTKGSQRVDDFEEFVLCSVFGTRDDDQADRANARAS